MLEAITTILMALVLFLCGVLSGMALVHKMYKKTIQEKQDVIDIQEENNIRILDVNQKYKDIIFYVLTMSDYASGKYIKEYIEKELTSDGQSKS